MGEYVDEERSWIVQAAGRVDDAIALGICMRHILIFNEIVQKYFKFKIKNSNCKKK